METNCRYMLFSKINTINFSTFHVVCSLVWQIFAEQNNTIKKTPHSFITFPRTGEQKKNTQCFKDTVLGTESKVFLFLSSLFVVKLVENKRYIHTTYEIYIFGVWVKGVWLYKTLLAWVIIRIVSWEYSFTISYIHQSLSFSWIHWEKIVDRFKKRLISVDCLCL